MKKRVTISHDITGSVLEPYGINYFVTKYGTHKQFSIKISSRLIT